MDSTSTSSVPITSTDAHPVEQTQPPSGSPHQADVLKKIRLALGFWENGDNTLSDMLCYSLVHRPDLPKLEKAWVNLLIAMNAQSPFLLRHAKEAAKLSHELAEAAPGNATHQRQSKLADNILSLVKLDMEEYAAKNGVQYEVTDDDEEDDMDWKNVRLHAIAAVVEVLEPSISDQLSSQFLSNNEGIA